jgi:hypothetical protein
MQNARVPESSRIEHLSGRRLSACDRVGQSMFRGVSGFALTPVVRRREASDGVRKRQSRKRDANLNKVRQKTINGARRAFGAALTSDYWLGGRRTEHVQNWCSAFISTKRQRVNKSFAKFTRWRFVLV